jgi:hypothetical protein
MRSGWARVRAVSAHTVRRLVLRTARGETVRAARIASGSLPLPKSVII